MQTDWPTVCRERKELRRAAGVSQQQLAMTIGVREETLMRWENGGPPRSRVAERAWVEALRKLAS